MKPCLSLTRSLTIHSRAPAGQTKQKDCISCQKLDLSCCAGNHNACILENIHAPLYWGMYIFIDLKTHNYFFLNSDHASKETTVILFLDL